MLIVLLTWCAPIDARAGDGLDAAPKSKWRTRVRPIANVVRDDWRGLQVAGVANVLTTTTPQAVQFSLVTNVSTQRMRGLQIAPFTNIASGDIRGLQLSGVNVSSELDRGVTIGVVNIARRNARGLQFGALNVAGDHVRGVQLGVINIAKTSSASFGILNLFWEGKTMMDASINELGLVSAGIRHGSGATYNTYLVGYLPSVGGDRDTFAIVLRRGGRFTLSEKWKFEPNLATHLFFNTVSNMRNGGVSQLQTLHTFFTWRPSARFAVYGGPSLNVLWAANEDGDDYMRAYTPQTLRPGTGGQAGLYSWVGLTLGTRLF